MDDMSSLKMMKILPTQTKEDSVVPMLVIKVKNSQGNDSGEI